MRDGVAHATDWWAVIFNPSLPYRLAHMLIASGLTAAFLVAGVSAYRWLRGDRKPDVLAAMRTGTYLAAVLIPVQILVGDLHGLNTLEHQPAKVAAMEGLWTTQRGAAAVLFGFPDERTRTTHFEIAIPKLASLYLVHSWDGEVKGLDAFEKHPPVAPVFFAFRVMVGVGALMLLVSWITAWRLRRTGEPGPLHARALVAMTFAGWLAVLAGWYTTEIGRQPWLVEGVLTTAEAATTLPGSMVALSLAMYLVLYAALLTAYVSVLFYLARKAGDDGLAEEPLPGPGTPALSKESAHA
jgi:cytochrome d ubiquinol oxidase subunit I